MRLRFLSSRSSWAALLLLVLATAWLAWTRQSPISYHDGLGWDGVDYAAVAGHVAAGERPRAAAPFVYRVGAPALVAWLSPADPVRGFRWLNGALTLALPLLLHGWLLRRGLRPATGILLSGLFVTQWHAPLRLTPFYPVHVDPLMWLFWLLALHGLDWSRGAREPARLLGWSLFALLALPVRELLLLPLLAQAIQGADPPGRWSSRADWARWLSPALRPSRWLPLALGLGLFLLIRAWALPTDSYGFLKTALLWLWLKSVPHYLHGLCQALGPGLLVLLLLGWRGARDSLRARPELGLLLGGILLLGWLGGSDTERLLYWGAPLFLWLAGSSLEACLGQARAGRSHVLWLAFLALGQALSQRLGWSIPDFPGTETLVWPLLSPLSAQGRYLDLWSQHAVPQVAVLSLAQYLLWIALGWLWGRRLLSRALDLGTAR